LQYRHRVLPESGVFGSRVAEIYKKISLNSRSVRDVLASPDSAAAIGTTDAVIEIFANRPAAILSSRLPGGRE